MIDACRWHVDAEGRAYKRRALEHFRDRYAVLLEFLRDEGLLADPSLGREVSDWPSFELRRSHLTDEGYELVRLCLGKWNPGFGQGASRRHLTRWRRELAGLRGRT